VRKIIRKLKVICKKVIRRQNKLVGLDKRIEIERTKRTVSRVIKEYRRLAYLDYYFNIPLRNNWVDVLYTLKIMGTVGYELTYLNNMEKEIREEIGFSFYMFLKHDCMNYYIQEYNMLLNKPNRNKQQS
jgi:hypothetical protein